MNELQKQFRTVFEVLDPIRSDVTELYAHLRILEILLDKIEDETKKALEEGDVIVYCNCFLPDLLDYVFVQLGTAKALVKKIDECSNNPHIGGEKK